MKKRLMKIFSKILVVILGLSFVSCKDNSQKPARIRIVNLEGKSKAVVMKTPELNLEALSSQNRESAQSSLVTEDSQKQIAKSLPRKNSSTQEKGEFAEISSQSIRNALQPNFTESAPKYKTVNQQPETELPSTNNPIVADRSSEYTNEKITNIEYDLSKTPSKEGQKINEKETVLTENKPHHAKNIFIENDSSVKNKSVKKTLVSNSAGATGKKFFVQVGSFSHEESAQELLNKMKKFYSGSVKAVEGEKTIYRAVLGPFKNKIEANKILKMVTKSGQQAVLIKG